MINCQALDNLGPVACVNVIEPFLQLLCAKGPPSILEPPRPRPWGYASSQAPSSSITFLLSPRISSNPDWFVVIYLFQNVHTAEQQQCNVNTIKVVLVSPFPKLASQHLNYVAYEMVIYFVRAEVYEWNEMRTSMNDKPSQDNHKRSKKFHQQFGIICHTYYICHRGCWCWLRVARLGHDCCFVISFFVSWRRAATPDRFVSPSELSTMDGARFRPVLLSGALYHSQCQPIRCLGCTFWPIIWA